jgi:signal transduction histidine kinase
MAVVAPVALDLVQCMVASTSALLSGEPTVPILRSLTRTLFDFPETDVRGPFHELMRETSVGDSGVETGVPRAHLAQALIETGRLLEPLVEAREQDLIREMNARLGSLAKSGGTVTPISGVFRRRDIKGRKAMDELVERQLSEAMLVAAGGAIHDAGNTLAVLRGTQSLMARYAQSLCALETEFVELTPIASMEGRLDFVQAVLDPLAAMNARIDGVLNDVCEVRDRLRHAAGDCDEAGRVVRELTAPGGKVPEICKGLKGLRVEIAKFLLKLRRTDLERWVDRGLIAEETRVAYDGHLAGLREQLEAARNLMELGFEILQGLARIDTLCRQQSCPFPVDLAEHLKPALLQSVLGSGVDLTLNVDEPRWSVPGPSKSIWQVIINLVGNARQAMKESGRLRVSALPVQLTDVEAARRSHGLTVGTPQAGDYMTLTIRDSGPGIAPDALPRIFDLFFSNNKSSGYGLAVTLKIVEDMGGFIGVDSSTTEPHGTVFTIYFPRAD